MTGSFTGHDIGRPRRRNTTAELKIQTDHCTGAAAVYSVCNDPAAA